MAEGAVLRAVDSEQNILGNYPLVQLDAHCSIVGWPVLDVEEVPVPSAPGARE